MRILIALVFLCCVSAFADSTNYARHVNRGVGVEINILWPLAPFNTSEIKFLFPVGDSTDLVVGFGRQTWTIGSGGKISPGTMDSNAIILGAKQYLFHTSTVAEYNAWFAHDRLTDPSGSVHEGYSISNEFFGGYEFYLGSTRATFTAGLNAGFWSYKSYTTPVDDRFVPTALPKLNLGYEAN
jgi:hypothetical protein